jgi:hydantoinase/carbamoylase family amidase
MTTDPFAAAGQAMMRRFDELGAISEEPQWLTRAYGHASLRQVQEVVAGWMRQAGMTTTRDAIGNLIGRYEADPSVKNPKMVVFGGHLDTVRNAGKYDGTLGVLSGLAAVEQMHAAGRRLPFAVEVVSFADEESYRFPTMYLGSSCWTGQFDRSLLGGTDADGVVLEDAVRGFGGDPDALPAATVAGDDLLAFVELHIEQGPVLEAIKSPIGIVSTIAGAAKYVVQVTGTAGHAGTVPMHLRRDALIGAAECVLAINGIANNTEDLVATVGSMIVAPNAKNVIPGHVEFSIDIRHQFDQVRQDGVARILEAIRKIGQHRDLGIEIVETPGAVSTPMDAGLIETWRQLFTAEGILPQLLPSGAGHDAVTVAKIAPVSMLFLRCQGGISHNPAESIREDDAATGIRMLSRFLERMAANVQ